MRKAKVLGNYFLGWEFKAPYDKNFVTELKDTIPSDYRSWNIENRVWWVDGDYFDVALKIARKYYDVTIDEIKLNTAADKSPYSVLFLRDDAPMEVVKAAHKALALIHHPDRGGNTETMKKINSAYDEIVRSK